MTTAQHTTSAASLQSRRLPAGGRIDRETLLTFTVDGVQCTGHLGDTVASALMANGRIRVGDSLYRGRPRGIVAAGPDEPNALLQIEGDHTESLVLATTRLLSDGLTARTVSGLGRLDPTPGEAIHDKYFADTEVLVVGGGPAGIAAALSAARSGARVILIDEQAELGGSLLSSRREKVNGEPALAWVAEAAASLAAAPDVTVLTRTVAFASYDGNYVLAVQDRADDPGTQQPPGVVRQRVWHVRAAQVVLATGARERPLVFAGNDRPGVMLANAVRTYVNRYAVRPGDRAVVATTNDSAYDAVEDLIAVGVDVVAVLDAREVYSGRAAELVARGVRVLPTSTAQGTEGDPGTGLLSAVHVGTLDDRDQATSWETLECDLLAVSGGWSPAVHLHSQRQGSLRWDERLAAFVPDGTVDDQHVVGAAAGTITLDACLGEGAIAGADASGRAGFRTDPLTVGGSAPLTADGEIRQLWLVPGIKGDVWDWDEHFVDLPRDQSVSDVWRAAGGEVNLDQAIRTMCDTGRDVRTGYQETALGGPAVDVIDR